MMVSTCAFTQCDISSAVSSGKVLSVSQNQLHLVETEHRALPAATLDAHKSTMPGLGRWVEIRSCDNSVVTASFDL